METVVGHDDLEVGAGNGSWSVWIHSGATGVLLRRIDPPGPEPGAVRRGSRPGRGPAKRAWPRSSGSCPAWNLLRPGSPPRAGGGDPRHPPRAGPRPPPAQPVGSVPPAWAHGTDGLLDLQGDGVAGLALVPGQLLPAPVGHALCFAAVAAPHCPSSSASHAVRDCFDNHPGRRPGQVHPPGERGRSDPEPARVQHRRRRRRRGPGQCGGESQGVGPAPWRPGLPAGYRITSSWRCRTTGSRRRTISSVPAHQLLAKETGCTASEPEQQEIPGDQQPGDACLVRHGAHSLSREEGPKVVVQAAEMRGHARPDLADIGNREPS